VVRIYALAALLLVNWCGSSGQEDISWRCWERNPDSSVVKPITYSLCRQRHPRSLEVKCVSIRKSFGLRSLTKGGHFDAVIWHLRTDITCGSIRNPDYADRIYFDFGKRVIKIHNRGLCANLHLLFHWKLTKARKTNRHAQFRSDFLRRKSKQGKSGDVT
jgi:hypothetical protein